MTRRLRVLSEHPHLGRPGDVLPGFEGAQAYVDAGFAEWVDDGGRVVDRSAAVETTDVAGAVEKAVVRPAKPATAASRHSAAASVKGPRND